MPNIWLVVLATFFGFAAHALSTDGGGSVLARLGVTGWALPKSAVAPMILVFGLAAGIFEGVQNGLPWGEAAARGVLASLTALFGAMGSQHLTGRGAMGIVALIGAGYLVVSMTACAAFFKAVPFLPKPNDLACVANDVEKNVTDPFTIIGDCPGLAQTAIADIEALVVNLVAAKKAAHRAAAEHAAEACDAGADAK